MGIGLLGSDLTFFFLSKTGFLTGLLFLIPNRSWLIRHQNRNFPLADRYKVS